MFSRADRGRESVVEVIKSVIKGPERGRENIVGPKSVLRFLGAPRAFTEAFGAVSEDFRMLSETT